MFKSIKETEEFILNYFNKNSIDELTGQNWTDISGGNINHPVFFNSLPEDFMEKHINKLSLHRISVYQRLSENFILKHWVLFDVDSSLWCSQRLSDKIIEKALNEGKASPFKLLQNRTLKLSSEFILKYADKVHGFYHIVNQKIDENILFRLYQIEKQKKHGFAGDFWRTVLRFQSLSSDFIKKYFNLFIEYPYELTAYQKSLDDELFEKILSESFETIKSQKTGYAHDFKKSLTYIESKKNIKQRFNEKIKKIKGIKDIAGLKLYIKIAEELGIKYKKSELASYFEKQKYWIEFFKEEFILLNKKNLSLNVKKANIGNTLLDLNEFYLKILNGKKEISPVIQKSMLKVENELSEKRN